MIFLRNRQPAGASNSNSTDSNETTSRLAVAHCGVEVGVHGNQLPGMLQLHNAAAAAAATCARHVLLRQAALLGKQAALLGKQCRSGACILPGVTPSRACNHAARGACGAHPLPGTTKGHVLPNQTPRYTLVRTCVATESTDSSSSATKKTMRRVYHCPPRSSQRPMGSSICGVGQMEANEGVRRGCQG